MKRRLAKVVHNNTYKFIAFTTVISVLIDCFICCKYFKELSISVVGIRLSAVSTQMLYFSILVIYLWIYLGFIRGRKGWLYVFALAVSPLSIFCLAKVSSEPMFQVTFIACFIGILLYNGVVAWLEKDFYTSFAKESILDMGKLLLMGLSVGLTVLVYECVDDYKMAQYASSVIQADPGEIGTLWEKNMEELRKLNEEYYVKLSLQEKLDVLGVVLQIEMKHLGIDGEIRLVSKSLSDSIAGYYSDTDKMIVLNDSIIDNVDEAILTVLHEVYHAMQYAVVDSLDKLDLSDDACELHYFRTVCEWQYDMEHYVGEENIAGWYSQEMEQDSISYSKERIESYLNYIYSLSNQE